MHTCSDSYNEQIRNCFAFLSTSCSSSLQYRCGDLEVRCYQYVSLEMLKKQQLRRHGREGSFIIDQRWKCFHHNVSEHTIGKQEVKIFAFVTCLLYDLDQILSPVGSLLCKALRAGHATMGCKVLVWSCSETVAKTGNGEWLKLCKIQQLAVRWEMDRVCTILC